MKKLHFLFFLILIFSVSNAQEKLSKEEQARRERNIQAGNPFKQFGYKAKVATLSKGKYLEFHDLDSIVTIGTMRWHVEKEQIVAQIVQDTLNPDAQPIGDRAGRWMSPDPLSEEFPDYSPYTFVFNNPLKYTDPTGMAPEDIIIISGKQQLKYENGNLFNKDGTAYGGKVDKFTQKTVTALGEISKSTEGAALVSELQSSKNTFTIEKSSANSFEASSSRNSFANIPEIQTAAPGMLASTGSGGKINFDPNSTSSAFSTAGNTNRPAFIGLAHEMVHARDSNNGVLYPYTDYNSFKSEFNGLYKSEWRSTFYENTIRGQLGLPLRTHYGVGDDGQGNQTPIGPSLLDSNKKPINYTIK